MRASDALQLRVAMIRHVHPLDLRDFQPAAHLVCVPTLMPAKVPPLPVQFQYTPAIVEMFIASANTLV